MTIAIQISFTGHEADPSNNFNYQCALQLAGEHPSVHFILIADTTIDPALLLQPNMTPVLLTPAIKNGLLQHYWYQFKLPRILLKYNATVFISSNSACCLQSTLPQIICLQNTVGFEKTDRQPGVYTRYQKKFNRRFATTAKSIIVTHPFFYKKLGQIMPALSDKLHYIPAGWQPLTLNASSNNKEAVRKKYAEGTDYFLFKGRGASKDLLLTVLKAFSLFKKWQQSNMHLVMLLTQKQNQELEKDLQTYKYKTAVNVILKDESNTASELLTAAYAFICLPGKNNTDVAIWEALMHNTALIVPDEEYYTIALGGAALYTASEEKMISQQMNLLYKDETLLYQQKLAQKAWVVSRTWQNASGLLWTSINAVIER